MRRHQLRPVRQVAGVVHPLSRHTVQTINNLNLIALSLFKTSFPALLPLFLENLWSLYLTPQQPLPDSPATFTRLPSSLYLTPQQPLPDSPAGFT